MRGLRFAGRKGLSTLVAAVGVGLAVAPSASAATFTVTTTADSGAGSLRAAIGLAGDDPSSVDTIDFAAGVGPTIQLLSALPPITGNTSIAGPGPGLLTIRGEGAVPPVPYTVFNFAGTGTISGLTITNGMRTGASAEGGGLVNNGTLTLDNVVITGNRVVATSSGSGGGIENGATRQLTIRNSTISNNTVTVTSAGAFVSASGGGVNFNADGGSLTIQTSLISANTVTAQTDSSVSGADAIGGGIALSNGTISNTTISGNRATAIGGFPTAFGGVAGGVFFDPPVLDNVTLANNGTAFEVRTASGNTFAGGANLGDTAELRSTLIADPVGDVSCQTTNASFTSGGNNFDEDGSCGLTNSSDRGGSDPLLGPLADNGGPTFTHALLPGSPAIDQGASNGLTTDQRLLARPVQVLEPTSETPVTPTNPEAMPSAVNQNGGDGADIGAFEVQASAAGPDPEPGVDPRVHFSLRFKYVDKHPEAYVVARVFCHAHDCDLSAEGTLRILPFRGRQAQQFKLGSAAGTFPYLAGRSVAGKLRFKVGADTAGAVLRALRAGARGRIRADIDVQGSNSTRSDITLRRFRNIKLFARSRGGASR